MRLFRQRPPDVPPWWADEIYKRLGLVLRNQEIIMTQVEDLNAAVSSLAKGYVDLHTAVVKQTDALTEAMKNVAQPDPATSKAISDAIANITGITGKMATDAAEPDVGGSRRHDRRRAAGDRAGFGADAPGVGTTSGGVMAGLALTITPATSGNLFLTGNISGSNSTAVAGCTVQISWGTGAAPTHNAVATGTAVGSANVATSATAAASVAIPVSSYVTGLTVGTAYWIDLLYGQNGGGTCTISGFNMQALEQ
jgi:hypothetical protein